MRFFCITLVSLGALLLLYGIIKFLGALSQLKKQMNERRLFGGKIYAACFVMMLFFFIGYVVYIVINLGEMEVTLGSFLIALIYFFGAIFVNAMIIMMQRMFTSITDEERMRHEKELAENGSRMKGEFLSRMSHEMRTPMNAIIGMTNIGKNANEIGRKDYCFGVIWDASKHLLGVINDVLDMSKIEASKLELSPEIFDFRKMMETVTELITPQTDAKNQQMLVSIDKIMPVAIKSDEQRLRQVIVNLLGNAVKFTPESGLIMLSVSVLSKDDNTVHAQFEVKDTGIGMSEEQRERLFMPFEQADSSISRKYGGTGLGLAISKQIIELMGSSITVESEPGKGSSFIFDLCVEFTDDSTPPWQNETGDTPISNDFTGKRGLIAEDIEINREIIEVLLEPTKIIMDFAENGQIAYNMFTANPKNYDIIFMDLNMPEINGLEAAGMIRNYNDPWAGEVPIIAMTADVFQEDIDKCLSVGMNGHIGKPIDINDVLAVLNKYLFTQE